MTDKQIIIDGCDVSGCVQFIQDEKDCCDLGGSCKGWPNCYYKQLKRKEQECEELKEYIKYLHNLCGNETDKQYEYKQTLTEIKEICKTNVCKHCHSKLKVDDNYCKNIRNCDCYNILQKISEVIKDE